MPRAVNLDVRDVVPAAGVAAHVRHDTEKLVPTGPVQTLALGCRRGTHRLARGCRVNLSHRGVQVVRAGEEPIRRALDVPVAHFQRGGRVNLRETHRCQHHQTLGVGSFSRGYFSGCGLDRKDRVVEVRVLHVREDPLRGALRG